jgi:hypothetical protein
MKSYDRVLSMLMLFRLSRRYRLVVEAIVMSRMPSRRATGAISVALAAAVAVLVNVWTSGWGWPAGVGVGVLVITQVILEWFRPSEGDSPNHPESDRVGVSQRARNLKRSHMTGVRHALTARSITVRQKAGNVEDSSITGVDVGTDQTPGIDSGTN